MHEIIAPNGHSRFWFRDQEKALFLLVAVVALVFAMYTKHAWEDYYITYRSSKNLALGHGLVFQPGERVHTFTSPINVLLPAFFSYIAGNRSDEFALWAYRVVCVLTLSAAAVLMLRLARQARLGRVLTILLLGMIFLDAKTLDFTVNGQEVAFMIFFLALMFRYLFIPSKRPYLGLGLAWAGLMYTRPDGVMYGAAAGLPLLLFMPEMSAAKSRRDLFFLYLRGVALTAVLYGPWLLWTWHYYGSLVPHTVTAKGLHHVEASQTFALLWRALMFPLDSLLGDTSLLDAWLPSYHREGGWSAYWRIWNLHLAWPAAFLWVVPRLSSRARSLSLSFLAIHVYLTVIAPGAYPWYIPATAFLGSLTLIFALHDLYQECSRTSVGADTKTCASRLRAYSCFVLAGVVILLLCSARQLRMQQKYIETGMRREIGLWLKENAQPTDTVFLECLGYIGYFSQLKMFDHPGLASPEVVEVRRDFGRGLVGARIFQVLKPDWAVLRPAEARSIYIQDPQLLEQHYVLVETFDAGPQMQEAGWIPGRGYLELDQIFYVMKRVIP